MESIGDVQQTREWEVRASPQPLPHHSLQWARQGRELPGLTQADTGKHFLRFSCFAFFFFFHSSPPTPLAVEELPSIHNEPYSQVQPALHTRCHPSFEMHGLGSKNNLFRSVKD